MINYDDIYCCDPRRAKRLLSKMRKAARHPPEIAPATGATYDITIYTSVTNGMWECVDLAIAGDAFWRRSIRKVVREAREMGLPRYPSQAGGEHE